MDYLFRQHREAVCDALDILILDHHNVSQLIKCHGVTSENMLNCSGLLTQADFRPRVHDCPRIDVQARCLIFPPEYIPIWFLADTQSDISTHAICVNRHQVLQIATWVTNVFKDSPFQVVQYEEVLCRRWPHGVGSHIVPTVMEAVVEMSQVCWQLAP